MASMNMGLNAPQIPHIVTDEIQRQFEAYNQANPQVLESLRKTALKLKRTGRTWYSMDALVHAVRVDNDLKTRSNDEYKVNNNFTSRYARLLMMQEPELVGFFHVKSLASRSGTR